MFKINLGDILRIIMLFGCTFAPLKAATKAVTLNGEENRIEMLTGKDVMSIISVSLNQIPEKVCLTELKVKSELFYNNELPKEMCLEMIKASLEHVKISSQDFLCTSASA